MTSGESTDTVVHVRLIVPPLRMNMCERSEIVTFGTETETSSFYRARLKGPRGQSMPDKRAVSHREHSNERVRLGWALCDTNTSPNRCVWRPEWWAPMPTIHWSEFCLSSDERRRGPAMLPSNQTQTQISQIDSNWLCSQWGLTSV